MHACTDGSCIKHTDLKLYFCYIKHTDLKLKKKNRFATHFTTYFTDGYSIREHLVKRSAFVLIDDVIAFSEKLLDHFLIVYV